MIIFTSYFACRIPGVKKVAISLYPPKWFDGECIPELAPSKETFGIKNNYEAYKASYLKQLDKLSDHFFKDILYVSEPTAYCCFEALKKPGEWCHRRMLAEYIEDRFDMEVEELTKENKPDMGRGSTESNLVMDTPVDINEDVVHKVGRLSYLGYTDEVQGKYLGITPTQVRDIKADKFFPGIIKEYNMEIPPNPRLESVPNFVNPDIDLDEPTHTYNLLSDPDFKFTSGTTFIKPFFDKFDGPKVAKELIAKGKRYVGLSINEICELWDSEGYLDESIEKRISKGTPRAVIAKQLIKFSQKYGHREVDELLEEWNQSGVLGTAVHKELEDYILSLRKTPITMSKARAGKVWIDKMFPNERFDWYPEVILYSKELSIAGTIDLLLIDKTDGTVYIFDWKTNKKIYHKSFDKKKGHQPATQHVDDCNKMHYALQLSLYRFLLERFYNCVCGDLYIVHLMEDNEELKTREEYKLIKCNYMESTILEMLKTLGYSE